MTDMNKLERQIDMCETILIFPLGYLMFASITYLIPEMMFYTSLSFLKFYLMVSIISVILVIICSVFLATFYMKKSYADAQIKEMRMEDIKYLGSDFCDYIV